MRNNAWPIISFLIAVCVASELEQQHLRTRSVLDGDQNKLSGYLVNSQKQEVPDNTSQNESATNTAMRRRRLQQTRTVLVVRVINSGVAPSVDARTIRQYIFTDTNSVKAQMMRCSDGKLIFTESWAVGVEGVMDVHVNTAMSSDELKQAAREAALRQLGIRDLRSVANHVLFIFPQIPEYFAEGETGYGLSYYNDHFGVSLAVVMHEVGHNLGVQGDEYGDYSGYMGLAMVKRGSPLMCYNAANHWDLGWFNANRRDFGFHGPTVPLKLELYAFTTVPVQGTVVLKIAGNVYMQYHHASKHNIDSRREYSNKIVIIEKSVSGPTIRLAALGPGEEYRSSLFVIQACAAKQSGDLRFMEVSIGRTSTSCNNSPLTTPSSQTQTTSSSWGNWNPVPLTTTVSVSNPPQPSTTSWWQLTTSNSWW